MAESSEPRDPIDALSRAATFNLQSLPGGSDDSQDSEPDSTRQEFDGEDFLFHIYRGSELLQDNCVEEAKEELERALRMQPRDVEGQGLLGVVYFRLGLYPRAIEIYEEIIRDRPNDITPKVNLGLCYLKTAQYPPARDVLEDVIRREPEHRRGWGYLGLVFERLGEYTKAQTAFERAGQPHLARRMQNTIEEASHLPSEPPPEQDEMRRAAADAVDELDDGDNHSGFSRADPHPATDPRSGRWKALEPGEEVVPPPSRPPPRRNSMVGRFGPAVPSIPVPEDFTIPAPLLSQRPSALIESASLVGPTATSRVAQQRPGVAIIRVEVGFALRHAALIALSHDQKPFRRVVLHKRQRGRESEEAFGSSSEAWSLLEGSGLITLHVPLGRQITMLELEGEFVYFREAVVIGFDASVRYENGRLPGGGSDPVPMVQFSGQGMLLVQSERPPASVEVSAERPLIVRAERVIGWTGRLLAHAVEPDASPTHAAGFVSFGGEGAVLVDAG